MNYSVSSPAIESHIFSCYNRATMKRYFLHVYGCQMNVSDGERLSSILEHCGFRPTKREADADLIGVVACSVRQTAMDRIFGQSKKWQNWKKTKPLVTMLTGCVLPLDQPLMDEIFDLRFPTRDMHHLPQLLHAAYPDLQPLEPKIEEYFDIVPKYNQTVTAYVPISFGCNNFCTYCAVPHTRGREISRPWEKIIAEVTALVQRGTKEIVLLGQNVNSYGLDKQTVRSMEHTRATIDQAYAKARADGEKVFPDLVQAVCDIPGDFWVRFLTSNPQDMSDELTDVWKRNNKLEQFVHLPLQAGNDQVLKRMNRRYTNASYFTLLEHIRRAMPDANITTDMIVGFPGETDEQFADTLRSANRARYTQCFTGKYSTRPGTVASQVYPDDVPEVEKKRRHKALDAIVQQSALAYNQRFVGHIEDVLVESFDGRYNIGHTKKYMNVRWPDDQDRSGQFVKLKITRAEPWSVEGEIIEHAPTYSS